MLKKMEQDTIPLLSSRESKSLTIKLSTIEENALFYQISRTLYELNHNIEDFIEDRKLYLEDHVDSIIKTNNFLKDVLIYIDFTGVFTAKNHTKKALYDKIAHQIFTYGLIIESSHQKTIHLLPFLKSGSMGRRSTLSFIRYDLKSLLDERINFDMIHENQKYSISKLQAYQGLYLSSGIRVELPELSPESVVIVNDYNKTSVTDSYTTALSRSLVKEMLYDMFFTNESNYMENMSFFHWAIIYNSKLKHEYSSFEFSIIYKDLRDAINSTLEFYSERPTDLLNEMDDIVLDEYNMLYEKIIILLGMNHLKDDDELIVLENVNIKTISNMFDGEGFIDKEYLEHINQVNLSIKEPPYHYSVQFRLPFVKGVLHAIDFQKWCKEGKITSIRDIFGNYREVSQIKIILTKSQFKCYEWIQSRFNKDFNSPLLPMQKYFDYFHKFHHALYITNTDQFEDQEFETILNYQVLHTPALTQTDFFKLLTRGNLNYINLVANPNKQVGYFIKSLKYYDVDNDYQSDASEQELLIKILAKNNDFIHDDIYQNRVKSYAETLLRNMKTGRIQIEGGVKILSGDLLELLNQITDGAFYRTGFTELSNMFYAPSEYPYYDQSKYYSILRNPHITSKELVYAMPIPKHNNSLREEYFSHLTGVIMLNTFANQMLAMQTADTDGDIVRIISNDIYTKGVQRSQSINQKRLLYFPSLKGNKTHPTQDMLYDSTKKSFSTRIGLMSNHAFSHSIFAYNENDSNMERRDFHRRIAEKMSFVIALEIDAVKSGKAPYYQAPVFSNPFIDYKSKVEINRNENVNFYIKSDSPNLYYLKDNAEQVLIEVGRKKLDFKKNHSNIVRFKFEMNPHWKQDLDISLIKDISKLVIAYLDCNKRLSYTMQPKPYFDNKIQSTLQYILSLQYDNISMIIALDNLLLKVSDMSTKDLVEIRDLTITDDWHLMSKQEKKEALLLKYFKNKLNEDEVSLLTNFTHSGHKILYLILSEVILSLENTMDADYRDFDSISRYKALLEMIFNRNKLDFSDKMKKFMEDAQAKGYTSNKLIKTYIDGTSIEHTSDYEKAKGYVKKIVTALSKLKNEFFSFELDDLDDISAIFSTCNKFMYDDEHFQPIWSIRLHTTKYINAELDRLFALHKVSRNDETKYFYALRDFDKSMRFMFAFAKSTMLNHVVEKSNGGLE